MALYTPPREPFSGQTSCTIGMPRSAYTSGVFVTIKSSSNTLRITSTTRSTRRLPPSDIRALFCPMRLLLPPARITPVMGCCIEDILLSPCSPGAPSYSSRVSTLRSSSDHLIGLEEESRGNGQAKFLRGLQVDHQLEFRGPLDGHVGRTGAVQDLRHQHGSLPIHVG